MAGPLSNQFADVLAELTPEGGTGREYSELDAGQREIVDEMLGGGERRDEYNALLSVGKAVNQLNKVVSGFTSSDDIEINYDPSSSATIFKLRKKKEEEGGGDELPAITWAERGQSLVVEIVDEAEERVQWGVGYPRSVAHTEE